MRGGSSDVPVQWFDYLLRQSGGTPSTLDGLYKMAGDVHTTIERRLYGLWSLVYDQYASTIPMTYRYHWLYGDLLPYFRPPNVKEGMYSDANFIIGTGWAWYPIDGSNNLVPRLGYRLWLHDADVYITMSSQICNPNDRNQFCCDTFSEGLDYIETRVRNAVGHQLVTR